MENIIKQAHANARKEDSTMESIIDDVGAYMHAEIKNMQKEKTIYPETDAVKSVTRNFEFIPPSLRRLLSKIIKGKEVMLKIASIGQAIIQAACPRSVLPPIQVEIYINFM